MVRKLLIISFLGALPGVLSAQDKSMNLFGDSSAKGPTIVTASQEANFDSKNHVAIFVGSVQVQDPQFSMTCDKLTVQLDKDQGGMKQANADGHVLIVSIRKDKNGGPDEKSTGKGDTAIYTTEDGRIALYKAITPTSPQTPAPKCIFTKMDACTPMAPAKQSSNPLRKPIKN
jgi:lipopolysaccharide transport protein LptA